MDENSRVFVYIVAHDAERNKDGDDKSYPFHNNYKHIWRKVVYWLIVLLPIIDIAVLTNVYLIYVIIFQCNVCMYILNFGLPCQQFISKPSIIFRYEFNDSFLSISKERYEINIIDFCYCLLVQIYGKIMLRCTMLSFYSMPSFPSSSWAK